MSNNSTANAQGWHSASKLSGTHPVSAEDLRILRAQLMHKRIACNFARDEINGCIFPGDLNIAGALESDTLLIVQGNLTITGNYHDYLNGIGFLVVLGELRVENLYSWGAIYVQQNLHASGLVLAVYNDYTFEVDGQVHARALVISDKAATYNTGKIGVILDEDLAPDDLGAQNALALRSFKPEFFTRPGNLEIDEYSSPQSLRFDDELGHENIRDGATIFRSTMAPESLIVDVAHVLSEAARPESLSPLIVRDPLLAQLIASLPELPKTLYAPLYATRDPLVLEWLVRRAPKYIAAQSSNNKLEITPGMAQEFVKDPALSAATLTAMVSSSIAKVRSIVGRLGTLNTASVNTLALDVDAGVRVATIAGQLHWLSPATISRLVTDSSPAVRQEIASASLSFADFQSLHAILDAKGLERLAESLRRDAVGERDARMSHSERAQAISVLLANAMLANATSLFLALPDVEQIRCLHALSSAERLDLGCISACARSVEVMLEIVALADRISVPIPMDLAKNPNLPLELQRLILQRAAASENLGFVLGDSPRGALGELMKQDGVADEIVLEAAKLALAEGYNPGDGCYQMALFKRRNLPRSAIDLLHSRLNAENGWAYTLLLPQMHVNQSELTLAIRRVSTDAAIEAQLTQAETGAVPFWQSLARAPQKELRILAAANINTPHAALVALTGDAEAKVALYARTNPNFSPLAL